MNGLLRSPHRRLAATPWRLMLALATVVILGVAAPVGAQEDPAGDTAPSGQDGPAVIDPEADSLTYQELAACISQNQKLLVVLLVDESGSLQQTDPDDARVAAVQRALSGLAALATTTESPPSVEVLLSVFSFDFQPLGDWTPVNDGTLPELQDQADSLAERDSGMDTDITNALSGAREALSERAVEVGAGDSKACKAVLLFTDGRYDIGVRRTDAQADAYGLTKEYAPGIVLDTPEAAARVREIGIATLCRGGGVADQVRGDRVTLINAALSVALREDDEEFLAAVARGAAGDTICGERSAGGLGAYVSGADGTALLRTFDMVAIQVAGGTPVGQPVPAEACPRASCGDGPVPVDVDAALWRVHLFVAVPTADTEVSLLAPGQESSLVLADREPGSTSYGGATVHTAWLSPVALTIDIEEIGDDAHGTWTVALRDAAEAAGSVQVAVFSDIVAVLVATPVVERGQMVTLEATIQTIEGEPAGDQIQSAEVAVDIHDPVTGSSTRVPLTPDGDRYQGTWAAPEDLTSTSLSAVVRLDGVTVQGVRISSVSEPVEITTRPPAGYPFVGPAILVLSAVTGEGTAEGDMIVIANGTSCLWVDDLTIAAAPAEVANVALTARGLGGSQADCTQMVKGDQLEVRLELDPGERASGTVRGSLRVWATAGDGEPLPTDLPFSFEMTRGVDEAKRLILAVALLAVGLLLPMGLLLVMNVVSTRFQSMDKVRGARVPVEVGKFDEVNRTDDREGLIRLLPRDFVSLAGVGGSKSFKFAGLEFRVHTSWNPFRPGHAVAAPAEGVADVARAARRVELSLSLAGSWIFLYDPDATEVASAQVDEKGRSRRRIRGHIVAFINEGAPSPQTVPMVEDILGRLPGIARELDAVATEAAAKGRGGTLHGRGAGTDTTDTGDDGGVGGDEAHPDDGPAPDASDPGGGTPPA